MQDYQLTYDQISFVKESIPYLHRSTPLYNRKSHKNSCKNTTKFYQTESCNFGNRRDHNWWRSTTEYSADNETQQLREDTNDKYTTGKIQLCIHIRGKIDGKCK